MSTLAITMISASVFIVLGLLAMSIGWLIGGDRKTLKACCGKLPDKSEESCCLKASCEEKSCKNDINDIHEKEPAEESSSEVKSP